MAEQTLTADDLRRYSDALAQGKRPTVYLIEAVPSLGLPGGASARVIEVSGTMVTVKPAGVDDQLPYEARELRATKAPKPIKPIKPAKAPSRTAPSKASSKASPAGPAAAQAKAGAPRSVAVTVFVGSDNVASVKVTRNAQKPAGAREVPLPVVHKALAGLGDKDATAAVGDVLSAARDAAADRVAALQAELAAAKKSLATLDRAKRGPAGSGGRR